MTWNRHAELCVLPWIPRRGGMEPHSVGPEGEPVVQHGPTCPSLIRLRGVSCGIVPDTAVGYPKNAWVDPWSGAEKTSLHPVVALWTRTQEYNPDSSQSRFELMTTLSDG